MGLSVEYLEERAEVHAEVRAVFGGLALDVVFEQTGFPPEPSVVREQQEKDPDEHDT